MRTAASRKIPKSSWKAAIAASLGNVIEWMDWAIYGIMAPYIAAKFFPSGDATVSLLQTYGVFAIGYLVRPIGAIVLGPYADKHGRNKALALSIFLVGGATGCIGVMPGYEQIGVLAPILIVVLRLIQGFSLGGEWGVAEAFIYEIAPTARKGFVCSFRPLGTGLGFFIGSALVTLITTVLPKSSMDVWGWRIPFLIAFFTALIGWYIRRKLPESAEFVKAKNSNALSDSPLANCLKNDKKRIAVVLGLGMIFTSGFTLIFIVMLTSLKTVGFEYDVAVRINSITMLVYTVTIPVFGWMSDLYSRKKMLIVSCLGYLALAYPGYLLIGSGGVATTVLVFAAFAMLMALYNGAIQTVLAEQFPIQTRTTAMALAFNLQSTLFGGTTPIFVTWATVATGSTVLPAYVLIACAAIALVAVCFADFGGERVEPPKAKSPVRFVG